jgi:hypothetical protein
MSYPKLDNSHVATAIDRREHETIGQYMEGQNKLSSFQFAYIMALVKTGEWGTSNHHEYPHSPQHYPLQLGQIQPMTTIGLELWRCIPQSEFWLVRWGTNQYLGLTVAGPRILSLSQWSAYLVNILQRYVDDAFVESIYTDWNEDDRDCAVYFGTTRKIGGHIKLGDFNQWGWYPHSRLLTGVGDVTGQKIYDAWDVLTEADRLVLRLKLIAGKLSVGKLDLLSLLLSQQATGMEDNKVAIAKILH